MSEMISAAEYRLFCRILGKDPDLPPLEGIEQQIMYASMRSGLVKVGPNGDYYLSDRARLLMHRYKEQLEKENAENARRDADREADRAYADENTQKQFRHDWRIAIFETFTGFILGAVFDHFFDIVGNAARLWLALKHVFLH